MIRLRATKHQRCALAPGGISEMTAPRAATAACRRKPRVGYGMCALAASTPIVRPGPSSAPACAAESMPIARPETTVISAADKPRPIARATSSPYVEARRAPTTPIAFRVGEHARVTEDVQHGRRVREVAQSLRVLVLAPAQRREPGRARPRPRRRRVEVRVAAPDVVRRADVEQVLVAQREHPRGRAALLELDLEPPGDGGDQPRSPQARVARDHGRTSISAGAVGPTRRGAASPGSRAAHDRAAT